MMLRFRKYSSQLQALYKEQNTLLDAYDELIVSTGCFSCSQYNSKFKSFSGRFENCGQCKEYQKIHKITSKLDSIEESIDSLIENEYAPAVFNYYCKRKPLLLDISGQIVSWNLAFGNDYQAVDKESKHFLVGLVEKTGKYKLK